MPFSLRRIFLVSNRCGLCLNYPAINCLTILRWRREKVRFAGEPVAVCVADSRADAEDIAQMVKVEYDILPAVTDMLAAKKT